jgi:hypothetical protein
MLINELREPVSVIKDFYDANRLAAKKDGAFQ